MINGRLSSLLIKKGKKEIKMSPAVKVNLVVKIITERRLW